MRDKDKAINLVKAYCKDEQDDVAEMESLLNHIENESYNDGYEDAVSEALRDARRLIASLEDLRRE